MKLISSALALATFIAQPALAQELTGRDLLAAIGGRHFDCLMGQTQLEWVLGNIASGATTLPYSATVHGKTVTAAYQLTDTGRLTSEGYGDERRVETGPDGVLTITRSDGRAMTCTAR